MGLDIYSGFGNGKDFSKKDVKYVGDVTIREGFQSNQQNFVNGIESMVEIARVGAEGNPFYMEVGFAGSPCWFEGVNRIAKEINGPYISSLARIVKSDMAAAIDAVVPNRKPMIHIFSQMVCPDGLKTYGVSVDDVIDASVRAVRYIRKDRGFNGRVEFSAQNVMKAIAIGIERGDQKYISDVFRLYSRVIAEGVDQVNFPDTEGRLFYFQTEEIFKQIFSGVKGIENVFVSCHVHNDFGQATANSIAALRAGVDVAEVSIIGAGERAGNAPLEEVVAGINMGKDVLGFSMDYNMKNIGPYSKKYMEHSGRNVGFYKPIIGDNYFVHGAGIHSDGASKAKKVGVKLYDSMNPADVGVEVPEYTLNSTCGISGVMGMISQIDFGVDSIGEKIHFEKDFVSEKIMPAFVEYLTKNRFVDKKAMMEIVRGVVKG